MRPVIKIFRCSNEFMTQKSVILAVNASLRWLNNVSSMYLTHVSCFLLVSRIWQVSSGIGPCFPLACGLCKFKASTGEKQQIQRQLLLIQYKQQANSLLSMNNYTPLEISRNNENKQLTLLSQRQLALTAMNKRFAL
jgi:hypothetical protein